METENFIFFFVISRGIALSKSMDITKFELDLRILMTLRIYTCNFNPIHASKQKFRERKLKISYFFSKFKRDNSVKINEPLPNSNLACVYL
jgi:hypothetical protein